MAFDRWKRFGGIALVLSTQVAFAEESWLVITSDSPGAAVSVDGVYRGTMPQNPGDALRIRVPEGERVIEIRKQINEKECAARQTAETIGNKETFMQFNLNEKSISTLVPSKNVDNHSSKLGIRSICLHNKLEIPGKNF